MKKCWRICDWRTKCNKWCGTQALEVLSAQGDTFNLLIQRVCNLYNILLYHAFK